MKSAVEVISSLDIDPEVESRFQGKDLASLLRALLDEDMVAEGIEAAGGLLTGRDCCEVTRQTLEELLVEGAAEGEALLFSLITHWFDDADDESRRLALAAAEKLEYGTPIALLAGAVGLLGSIAPLGSEQDVRVDDSVVADMASSAALLAVTALDSRDARFGSASRFVDRALAKCEVDG